MACSILRPSFILLALMLSAAVSISGNPIPDTADKIGETFNDAYNTGKGFFDRLVNTFTGKVDKDHPGLSTWETIAVVAVAVLVLLILPCCICFCLCECVKELCCGILCCGWCRD